MESIVTCAFPPQMISDLETAGAVAELVLPNAELVQDAQIEIRHRSVWRVLDVTASFELTRCASNQENRQRIVIVLIAVAECAAVQNQGMI